MIRLGLALLLASLSSPTLAQTRAQGPDARIDRLEKELKAVQRKIFPGGDPAFFEAEIAAPRATVEAGQPAGTPLNELTTRIGALEQELTRLTAQLEQDQHRLAILSEQAAKDRAEFDARLKALEPSAPAPAPTTMPDQPAPPRPGPAGRPRATDLVPPVKPAVRPEAAAPKPVETESAPTAVASNDPAEAAYMAGYNLWTAKKYPEAQTALAQVVAKYPRHKRASYAQNLLGRAFLDAGRPANAAQAFATNYQTNPRGERAPDSLYYLGVSLTRLNKNPDACKVYAEFDAAYGATAEGGLKDKVAAGRKAAQCR